MASLVFLAVIASAARAQSWTSGTYVYDGAGNIRAIGADTYTYDSVRRLVSGTADKQRSGAENRQDYGYDAFGNRITTTTTSPLPCRGGISCAGSPGISPASNHVAGYTYDDAGNVIQAGPLYDYTYDPTGAMTKETYAGGGSMQFVYAPDGTRIAVYAAGEWKWTVRGPNGTVLREYTSSDAAGSFGTASWRWKKDYVYRNDDLLSAEAPSGRSHFHLDHLGTPRLITADAGATLAYHAYYPFGAEVQIFPVESIEEQMKFTGHERDTIESDTHTLDYMRARYASPFLGSFFSIDPVGGDPHAPQTWNRYAYVHNNPMLLTDFTGMVEGQKGCTQGTAGSKCASEAAAQLEKKPPQPAPPPPPDTGLTLSTGLSFTGNLSLVQGSAQITGNFDTHGGAEAQVTLGLGPSTGVTSFVIGPTVMVTNAGTVENLRQRGSSIGGSGGEGLGASVDHVTGPRGDGSHYSGWQVTPGFAGNATGLEAHRQFTNTWTVSDLTDRAVKLANQFINKAYTGMQQTFSDWDNAARRTITTQFPQP